MPADATLLVTRALHDRIDAAAHEHAMTPDTFLSILMADYERDVRMAAVRAAMAAATPAELAAYRAETRALDGLGPDDEPAGP